MSSDRIFELGLSLAGGATRGAYSAGAMDFLLQALNELEAARSKSPSTFPPWRVRVKTLAGTSAGGITAAIATGSICTPFDHLSNSAAPPDPRGNNLFNVWVNQVSLDTLFSNSDLDPEAARRDDSKRQPICSLLNSRFLPATAKTALDAERTDLPLPAWAECLQLYVTTSNLRGIPYEVENFQGADRNLRDLRMTRHRDWVGFRTGECSRKGLFALDLMGNRNTAAWDRVRAVAQGTAALPLIFPLIKIQAPTNSYVEKLTWGTPAWPELMSDEFEYHAIDGGVFRNEPLELVRAAMESGEETEVLTEQSEKARGAMILLHPSPTRETYDPRCDERKYSTLLNILMAVLTSLIDEANFQEKELAEIADERNISRFMIAPVREGRTPGQEVLATDTFRGFGGIIGKDVRLHDFQLGRRNAQRFLSTHFVAPLEAAKQNPIFGEEAEKFALKMGEHGMVVPIVPLVGRAEEECPLPKWPVYDRRERDKRRKEMHDTIEKRIEVVLKSFAVNLDFYKNGFRCGIHAVWNFVVDRLVGLASNEIMERVDGAIEIALDNFRS